LPWDGVNKHLNQNNPICIMSKNYKASSTMSKEMDLLPPIDECFEEAIEVADSATGNNARRVEVWREHSGYDSNNKSNDDDTDELSTTSRESTVAASWDLRSPPFEIWPALEPSLSVLRYRAKKLLKQEQRWEKRYGGKNNQKKYGEKNQPANTKLKKQDGPIDLDDIEEDDDSEEEGTMRRYSNHGSFGILPHIAAVQSINGKSGCRSYRRDRLIRDIDDAHVNGRDGHDTVLTTLRDAGVMVYIIDSKVCITLDDVVDAIRKVIAHVCSDKESLSHPNHEKCLLYRDVEGRLFNLTVVSTYISLTPTWESNLQSCSVLQATTLLVILQRSFACAVEDEVLQQNLRPAFLALVLGLVFSEELALSWTNVAMLVRGIPSISAYALITAVDSDWPKKVLLFLFSIAASATGLLQKVCTFAGLALTCCVLLANLGSRSWKYLHWKPTMSGIYGIGNGPFAPTFAYMTAILTGICFPYLGHRQVESNGTTAVESVLRIAIVVAGCFILSDYDEIQKFLLVGSEKCSQDYVNLAVGAWWGTSLMASLTILFCRPTVHGSNNSRVCIWPMDDEPLLEKDQASPVGYTVPHLPQFPVDPSLVSKGWMVDCCCSMSIEYGLGMAAAIVIGGFICYLGITDQDELLMDNPV
jgi:hypothetical protein